MEKKLEARPSSPVASGFNDAFTVGTWFDYQTAWIQHQGCSLVRAYESCSVAHGARSFWLAWYKNIQIFSITKAHRQIDFLSGSSSTSLNALFLGLDCTLPIIQTQQPGFFSVTQKLKEQQCTAIFTDGLKTVTLLLAVSCSLFQGFRLHTECTWSEERCFFYFSPNNERVRSW